MGYFLWAKLKVQHHRSTVLHKYQCVCWDKSRSNTLYLTYSTYSFFFFSLLAVRSLNDQLMFLERAFIDPLGLPGRPFYRWERLTFHFPHGVRYENSFKIYRSLNGVTMILITTVKLDETGGIRLKRGNDIEKNFSVTRYTEWGRVLLEAHSDNFSWFHLTSKQM